MLGYIEDRGGTGYREMRRLWIEIGRVYNGEVCRGEGEKVERSKERQDGC